MNASPDDAALIGYLIQIAITRDIRAPLTAALSYNEQIHGRGGATNAGASNAPQQGKTQKKGRGRSRSRGKSPSGSKGGNKSGAVAPPAPSQVTLASFLPTSAGGMAPVPLVPGLPLPSPLGAVPNLGTASQTGNVETKTVEPASVANANPTANQGERGSLINRLRDERQQFKAAFGRLLDAVHQNRTGPQGLLVAWAKAANLRSKLANNYAVRDARGWSTANAKTFESDVRDAGGDPGEPEFLGALTGWPVYEKFVNGATDQVNQRALVMQSANGQSLWEHPEALPEETVRNCKRFIGDASPPLLSLKGEVARPPDQSTWRAILSTLDDENLETWSSSTSDSGFSSGIFLDYAQWRLT